MSASEFRKNYWKQNFVVDVKILILCKKIYDPFRMNNHVSSVNY